jgi:hypothetical protein
MVRGIVGNIFCAGTMHCNKFHISEVYIKQLLHFKEQSSEKRRFVHCCAEYFLNRIILEI